MPRLEARGSPDRERSWQTTITLAVCLLVGAVLLLVAALQAHEAGQEGRTLVLLLAKVVLTVAAVALLARGFHERRRQLDLALGRLAEVEEELGLASRQLRALRRLLRPESESKTLEPDEL